MKIIKESIELHSELNPRLFNQDNQLKEDVRNSLLNICKYFIEGLQEENIPLRVVDIWLLGSNAAYNYTKDSDIDVHIMASFDELEGIENIIKILYNYVKSDFNKSHDIKVKGHEVELYIEDMNTTAISNGIYSILYNEWIKVPTKMVPSDIESLNIDVETTDLYKQFYNQYQQLNTDINEIQDFINRLYILRNASLINDGEFGLGNLVFKELRNNGVLQKLKDKLRELKSKELTLEKLEKRGQCHRQFH